MLLGRVAMQVVVGLGLAALVACTGPFAFPPTDAPVIASAPPATGSGASTPAAVPTAVALSGVRFSTRGWKTDFAKAQVPLSEFESGGPPRDGIPPIDRPKFVSPAEAGAWLKDQ